jgi:hypothetical protein
MSIENSRVTMKIPPDKAHFGLHGLVHHSILPRVCPWQPDVLSIVLKSLEKVRYRNRPTTSQQEEVTLCNYRDAGA